jgi:hypothetical protein
MGYKSKFNGAEIDERLSASGLFCWFIPSDEYASDYDLAEEEFQAMIAHNAEVYKVLDSIFKNKGYVPNVDLVGFAYDGVSYYGRISFKITTITAYVLAENSNEPEEWGSYNYDDTVIEFSSNFQEAVNREIYDTLCPDGRFYYQRSSGGGPV